MIAERRRPARRIRAEIAGGRQADLVRTLREIAALCVQSPTSPFLPAVVAEVERRAREAIRGRRN